MQYALLLRASVLACLSAMPVFADVTFANFAATSGLNFQGDAGVSGTRLQLTADQPSESGSVWFASPQLVAAPFVCEFVFRWGGAPGADGFAFVIQNDSSNALGGDGCEMAYHGINNGLAVEFDPWQNAVCAGIPTGDPTLLHLSVHTSGTGALSIDENTSLGSTTLLPNLSDGAEHLVRLNYVPGSLLVFVDDLSSAALTVSVDLAASLNLTSGEAWVGFTAATGGASQAHQVSSWSFTENSSPSGNMPPQAPLISEPQIDGQIVNPFDVHMETSPFADSNAGDQHLCTDWEIWTVQSPQRVWASDCASGPEAVHAHLGDGSFIGTLAGQTALLGSTSYFLRVRHSDDSGDSVTRWSAWSTRVFVTGAASQVFELEMDDVLVPPLPIWQSTTGTEIILPSGLTPPSLTLESETGELLVSLSGLDDASNEVQDGDELALHGPVRIVLNGGSTGVVLPETDFTVTDHECETHEILLPAVTLSAGQSAIYWISFDGSSYIGSAGQTSPDFSNLARGQSFPWVVPDGLAIDVFASDFELPVNIAFIPNPGPNPTDPLFYVTELYGTIKVVDRSGSVGIFASGLLDFMRTGAFPGSGEQGLAGIAVDDITGDVYAGMLRDSTSQPGTHFPKVVRFTSLDGGRTAATQTTILDMAGESQGQSHQISHLEIHPDRKLIVHMGDGFVASTALDLSSFRGKILRMNLDGTAASDNPFYNAGNGISARDYVWAYGVRNPFGGAYRHTDGLHYAVENGPSVDRFTRVTPGANFGWNGSNASMTTGALHSWLPAVGPVNIAFIESQVFNGSGFPAEFYGRGYVTESGPTYAAGAQANGKRISQWIFDGSGDPVLDPENPYLAEYVGIGRATTVGLAAGPDGLYMTELYADGGSSPAQSGARILRIRHVGGVDCNDNGVPDVCDVATGGSTDLNADGIPDECTGAGAFCFGDGGDQGACTPCPCSNETVPGTRGGCRNSTGGGARLWVSGLASESADTLRIEVEGAPGSTFGFLASGTSRAPANPANPCFAQGSGLSTPILDGLRCVVQGVLRHGSRATAADGTIGSTTAGWGAPNGPAGGLLAQAGLAAGQTRHFQVFYRDSDQAGCMTGVNTTEGLTVVAVP